MAEIRKLQEDYEIKDIFNFNESSLFYRATLDYSLSTKDQEGIKLKKERVTVAFIYNTNGSRKLDPLIINNYETPRCFTQNRVKIESKPILQRWNSLVQSTTTIMLEYFKWFDKQMTRKTLLLIDGYSTHIAVVKYIVKNKDLAL